MSEAAKRARIKRWFSNLKDTFAIRSEWDPSYNCFAFSVHDTENWWEYDAIHENEPTYWPPELTDSDTVRGYIEALRYKEFEEADNCDLEQGIEKVAVYGEAQDLTAKPTHVARQEPSGIWKSKLGRAEDIEHDTPEELCGSAITEYGVIVQFLKRKRSV